MGSANDYSNEFDERPPHVERPFTVSPAMMEMAKSAGAGLFNPKENIHAQYEPIRKEIYRRAAEDPDFQRDLKEAYSSGPLTGCCLKLRKRAPGGLRLLGDRLLVRWEEEPEHQDIAPSILIPETARSTANSGRDKFTRIGIVVAAGPGDRCGVFLWEQDPQGDGVYPGKSKSCEGRNCPRCHGTGYLPMAVKVGDRIWYDHNSDCEFTIEDQKYVIMVESRILGVIHESATAA